MRSAVGVFGLLCGLIVIGLVGRYGFMTTDVEVDAWIIAFLFATIAACGLFGHAVAVRLWRGSKVASMAFGLVSAAALLLNLSNSLGAIAGRQDTAQQERVEKNRQIRAAEAELKRLTGLRDAMPAFVPTDEAAVQAAKRAADAASEQRKAECETRGKPAGECRRREDAERMANDRLAQVTAARAATDKATELETDVKAQRDKLADLGPALTVNAQGSAIAKLFRLPDTEVEFAATAQQFGIAIVVEMIIVMCVVAWEVLGRWPQSKPMVSREMKITAPAKPRLVTASDARPAGSIIRIMTDALEPAIDERLDFVDAYKVYVAGCRAEGSPPLCPEDFADGFRRFCDACGIGVRRSGGTAYLMNVRCASLANDDAASSGVRVSQGGGWSMGGATNAKF